MNDVFLDSFSGFSAWLHTQMGRSVIQEGRQKGVFGPVFKLISDSFLAESTVLKTTEFKDKLSDNNLSKSASEESVSSVDSMDPSECSLKYPNHMSDSGKTIDSIVRRTLFNTGPTPTMSKQEVLDSDLEIQEQALPVTTIEILQVDSSTDSLQPIQSPQRTQALGHLSNLVKKTPNRKSTPRPKSTYDGLEVPLMDSISKWQNSLRK